MTSPSTHTLTVTTEEYARISAALGSSERAERIYGTPDEANAYRNLARRLAEQVKA